uniref:Uncharacterized protein n=1 Tax=Strombidium rassoulzadegani TaxID=1082188 RepID=A0A7S3FUP0_9SPIT
MLLRTLSVPHQVEGGGKADHVWHLVDPHDLLEALLGGGFESDQLLEPLHILKELKIDVESPLVSVKLFEGGILGLYLLPESLKLLRAHLEWRDQVHQVERE